LCTFVNADAPVVTYTQVKEILAGHDKDLEAVMKARLDEFTRTFLHMTFMEQPRDVRRATKNIDVSFDQTYIKTPNQKGYSKKKVNAKAKAEIGVDPRTLTPGPVEVFAGWYPKTGDHPDLPRNSTENVGPDAPKNKDYGDFAWGWVANIAVRVDSEEPGQSCFPKIAVSATLSMPNLGVSEEAVSLLKSALGTGLPAGVADADKAYFANALVDRLHEPAVNLGFTPSTDYRADRLRVQGQKGGAELIEGKYHCPAMPIALKNATIDLVTKKIDEETFQTRRKIRTEFELRPKEKADEKGRTPMMCPAAGDSPTVTCPIGSKCGRRYKLQIHDPSPERNTKIVQAR
jgi:hypothetical protein